MHNQNSTNTNSENQKALSLLKKSHILHQAKVNLRYLIRADTGEVEYCGPNITGEAAFIQTEPRLSHFSQIGECVSRSGYCKRGPAKILAMTYKRGSPEDELHLRASLPVNLVATDLFKEPDPTLEIFYPDRPMFGDAALITGSGEFWALSRSGLPEDELRDFAEMLTTPWEIRSSTWQSELIFIEEPNMTDLISMRLRWG